MPTLDDELNFVKGVVVEAAAIARDRAASVVPTEKSNQSYVTDLDHDLERLIRARLAERFPCDRLTGEEYAPAGGHGQRSWSIDPIDGTGNMVHGLPLWAVSIGLIDAGEPVLGVIAIPPLRELYWAVRGQGAWRAGQRLIVRDAGSFHDQDNVCLGTNAMRAVDPRTVPGRLRDLGSACCELAFTATGRLAAAAFLGEQTHDIAAGAVLVAEAGCQIGTIAGRVLSPAEFVASTPLRVPTFVAAPRRLECLMRTARMY
jgi:myo-inositol-1(or 4)-monophosphatase